MNLKSTLLIPFLFLFAQLTAQDAYHTYLTDLLQDDYGVTVQEWVLANTETAILNEAYDYGTAGTTTTDISDQVFSKKTTFVIANSGGAPWDAGWGIRNNIAIQTGDVLLATFYLRTQSGEGEANFFVENAATFEKEVILTLPITENWTRYFSPF